MSKLDTIFKESEKAFLSEFDRREVLGKRAEKIVAAAALVMSAHLVNLDHLTFLGKWQDIIHTVFATAAFILLGISIVLSLLGSRVLPCYSYPRGTELLDELKGKDITEVDAKVKLLRFYLKARDKNATVNDKRAKVLSLSGTMLIIGFTLAVASHLLAKFAE